MLNVTIKYTQKNKEAVKISQKIYWCDPESTSVTKVKVAYCDTKNGTYIVSTTINATSDGSAKSATNTWVNSYTDAAGNKTYWYKICMGDGTYWSDYSDPITGIKEAGLCTIADIKKIISATGRWTDSEIQDAINEVTAEIYDEMGKPIAAAISDVGKIDSTYQSDYYVGERDIYSVDRVFYGTTTKNEVFLDDGFQVNLTEGMIRLATTGTSAVTLDSDCEVEIEYVPKIIHKYAKYSVAQRLLEQVDTTAGGETSKELEVINNKLNAVDQLLKNRYCLAITTDYQNYNTKYGVNRRKIEQDHDRNAYLGKYGFE